MRKLLFASAIIVVAACRDASAPTNPLTVEAALAPSASVTTEASCAGGTSIEKLPLTDLRGCYLSYRGGLYPNGLNTLPDAHLAAGLAAASRITPLDLNGQPSANGKYVMLAIGMSNTTQEFCDDDGDSKVCRQASFMGQAADDSTVNRGTLAIVNGAFGSRSAPSWVSPSSVEYDRIRDRWLTPLGLSEKQVQIAWVKVANRYPTVKLPNPNADAFVLESQLGQINRALKKRYPNLRQVFISSRIFAGYATIGLNPEPYAYESGFAVKWTIEAQVRQMMTGVVDGQTRDVRYDTGVASWMAWGPYLWASGMNPRSDGLTWARTDFVFDGTHPAMSGRRKVGTSLLTFFKTSPVTSCWFLAGRSCQ